MTTTAFGGGPDVSQRRDFAGLKDGTHVPGYLGYCPQIKYRVGKTYGQDTHELAQTYEHRHSIVSGLTPQPPKYPIRNSLPESTGDNKLTKDMVPGYTGYIPRWAFKFGNTYKEDCDVCIDEHLTNFKNHNMKTSDLARTTRSFPRLQAINKDPAVRDHLNTYRDSHPGRAAMMDSTRAPTEPPIPGYQGYIPRIHTTELGLGCRYHDMTRNGLQAFQEEQMNHRMSQSAPVTLDRTPGAVAAAASVYNKRLYPKDGMIPKYTGYLPQRRYHFGNTYGDTTRSLPVCKHPLSSYGDYVRSKPPTLTASLA